jgi:hypothetical protein
METDFRNHSFRWLMLIVIAASVLGVATAAPANLPQSSFSEVISCKDAFSSGPVGSGTANPYVPTLAALTNYNSIVSISLLIILMVLMVLGIVYAFGFAFHVDSLINFAKTELQESFANLIIIAVVGGGMAFAFGAITFFANFGTLQSSAPVSATSTSEMYVLLCDNIESTLVMRGLENWFGVFLNLYITNLLASNAPPGSPTAFTIYLMPNGFGIAFTPYQGMSLVTTLLWDEQTTYFGSIFMGVFMIVILFIVYFLFPLFLYAGIALRSFPWTRAAGGSFIALFIAFYIVFPALIYPFTNLMNNPVNNAANPGAYNPSNPEAGQGFCTPGSQFYDTYSGLCTAPTFLTSSFSAYENLVTFDFGSMYYDNVYAFVQGIEFVGVNLVGLIIALLISYELVEKIGSLLGAPSLQGSRVMSRIL